MRTQSGLILLLSALTSLMACGGGNSASPPPPPKLVSIAVSPGQVTVAAGMTQQLSAKASYSDGTTSSAVVSWSSSDTSVATVDATGLVTTYKAGTVNIGAALGAISASAGVTVGPPVPVSLKIVPANSSGLIASAPAKLSAILVYSDASTQDVSATASWSSSNTFTATVDNSGNTTPLRIGYTTISSASGGFSASAAFIVTSVPRYLYFTDNSGRVASKATVDSPSGRLRMTGYIPTGANQNSGFHCVTTDPTGAFLVVGSSINHNGLSGEIQIYSVDPSLGTLTPLLGSPFAQPSPVGCLDFEPTGKFAYAPSSTNSSTGLITYSFDSSSGNVSLINSMDLGGIPSRAAIDPAGRYLYVVAMATNFRSASLLGYTIDSSTGALTAIPGPPISLPNTAGSVSFHPTGNFIFLANTNGASIDSYSVDRATGKLTSVGTISTCVNPTTLRFSADGNFAYTGCSMDAAHDSNSASVDTFNVAANGALTHLNSAHSLSVPSDLTVDPSGQFVYMDELDPYVQLFQIASDGIARFVQRFGIPPNPGFSIAALGGTSGVKYSPQTAYITSTADDTLSTYTVNSNGTLLFQQSTPTPNPFFYLSLWPWGTEIAMASAISKPNLLAFPVSPVTGSLGSSFSFGDAAIAGGVAIDPSGQFAFETDSANGIIYTYDRFGNSWGLVQYVPPTTFTSGAGAGPIVIDPSGVLVYVANQVDNTISVYQYWGTSPELFESKGAFVQPYTDGSPFPIGASPIALAIDPSERFLYVTCADQTLRVFAIDYASAGHISQVASVSLPGRPTGLSAEPGGNFVYTADNTGLSAFAVDPVTGALSPVSLNPGITLANITGVYAEPAGQYLYIATGAPSVAGAIFGYSIQQNGNLSPISPSALATPALPSSMAFADVIR